MISQHAVCLARTVQVLMLVGDVIRDSDADNGKK